MKFLAGTIFLAALVIMLMIAGLLSSSPQAAALGFCSFSGFVFPLTWVAIYRFFSRHAVVLRRKG